jgi:hypothetical protein
MLDIPTGGENMRPFQSEEDDEIANWESTGIIHELERINHEMEGYENPLDDESATRQLADLLNRATELGNLLLIEEIWEDIEKIAKRGPEGALQRFADRLKALLKKGDPELLKRIAQLNVAKNAD